MILIHHNKIPPFLSHIPNTSLQPTRPTSTDPLQRINTPIHSPTRISDSSLLPFPNNLSTPLRKAMSRMRATHSFKSRRTSRRRTNRQRSVTMRTHQPVLDLVVGCKCWEVHESRFCNLVSKCVHKNKTDCKT
ncbi:hypothetical protein BCR33DRAFT_57973 [Rhizoclosmatium globosum]|uniref:Uncharacterized protein n=1 Tax=Rhizoclosmatium globosum TaxID=329046 RepID=A0A1Y2CMC0_9FUNG|nr:hypothetical protein BCR33DRAFT_57973 [Rhizoclosmatium globosum]|eukprot:ORY48076.1 hypothetical protein BCR33DRAFT_57973 [Rhizoclosmatium globosum]